MHNIQLCRVAMSTMLLVWDSHLQEELQQDLDAAPAPGGCPTHVMGSKGRADGFLSQWIEVPTR